MESVEIKEYKSEKGNWDLLLINGKQVAMSKVDDVSSTSVHSIVELMKRAYKAGEQRLIVNGLSFIYKGNGTTNMLIDTKKLSLGGGYEFITEILYNTAGETSAECHLFRNGQSFPLGTTARKFKNVGNNETRNKSILEDNKKCVLADLGSVVSKTLEKALEMSRQMEEKKW